MENKAASIQSLGIELGDKFRALPDFDVGGYGTVFEVVGFVNEGCVPEFQEVYLRYTNPQGEEIYDNIKVETFEVFERVV